MAKRLTERVHSPFAGTRIDRDAGVIHGVLICGTTSANGRDYPASVFRRDFAVYEGRPVNCDHGREATVDRRIGWFSGVRCSEDGRPRGSLHLLKSHPLYERVMEAAERNPSLYGFSHVAMCETKTVGGREVVESIRSVESVDLVAEPATTKGLFESKGSAVKISLKMYVEKRGPKWGAKKWRQAERLCEELGDVADVPSIEEPTDDAGGEGGDLKTALMSAIGPMLADAFETGNSDKVCSAIKDFIKLHAKHSGGGDSNATDADTDTDTDDGADMESRRPRLADVIRECREQGYTATPEELVVLSETRDPEARKAYIAAQRSKVPGEKPSSGRIASGRGGKQVQESKVPTDGKAFAAAIRE